MLFNVTTIDTHILTLLYLFTYNLTILTLLTVFMTNMLTDIKTIYNLNKFSYDTFSTLIITLSVLSMAGVPPLIGFFPKLFILILLFSSNLIIFYLPFFINLFTGLYFYIQLIRFIIQLNKKNYTNNSSLHGTSLWTLQIGVLLIFFLTSGFLFIDDLYLLITWLIH